MIGHLLFVIRGEARNRLRAQAARLRNPRYALALLVGLAYFFFAFGGHRALSGQQPVAGRALFSTIGALGPLMLATYSAATWIFGRADALALRPAEVAFLLTGPLTRRDLLRYKLLQAQVPLLFSASFVTLISHGTLLPWYLRLPSFWMLFSILQLHHTAAALVRASAERQGAVGWRRNWLPVTLFGAGALVLAAAVQRAVARAGDVGASGLLAAVQDALAQPLPHLVLAPFRLALGPLLAPAAGWPTAFALAALVLLLHYAWVLRSDSAYEEAAAEAGERRARAAHALRSGGGWRAYSRALRRGNGGGSAVPAPPFRLALSGAPAVAITWKNLTFARRNTSLSSPLMLGVLVVAFVALSSVGGGSPFVALGQVGLVTLAASGFLVIFGPVMIRNDLRMDLRRVELLRTLPLPPQQLVGAEIAASAITVSITQLALLTAGVALVAIGGDLPLTGTELLLAWLGAMLLIPALATLGVTIQCAIALTFPAWVRLWRDRPAGVEAMGQNILTMVGSMLLLAILLLAPVALAGATALVLVAQWGVLAPVLGGLLGLAVVYAEVWLAARALGRLFARTDPSEIGLAR